VSEENGKSGSSAPKECEFVSEACMAFGVDDLALSDNDKCRMAIEGHF